MGRSRALALSFALTLVVGACGTGSAGDVVEEYLVAVSIANGDRGWSLLHPEARAEMFGNNQDAYRTAADAHDWSGFAWSVEEVVPDNPTLYIVRLTLPRGRQSVPPFLVLPRNNFMLLSFSGEPGRAEMMVRFEPGGMGIWPYGG